MVLNISQALREFDDIRLSLQPALVKVVEKAVDANKRELLGECLVSLSREAQAWERQHSTAQTKHADESALIPSPNPLFYFSPQPSANLSGNFPNNALPGILRSEGTQVEVGNHHHDGALHRILPVGPAPAKASAAHRMETRTQSTLPRETITSTRAPTHDSLMESDLPLVEETIRADLPSKAPALMDGVAQEQQQIPIGSLVSPEAELNSSAKSPLKRKAEKQIHQDQRSKKRNRQSLLRKASSNLEITNIPTSVAQPAAIDKLFSESREISGDWVPYLTAFFYAIASPQAFRELRDACNLARTNQGPVSGSAESTLQTLELIDRLESNTAYCASLRRYYLSCLLHKRKEFGTRSRSAQLSLSLETAGKNNGVDAAAITNMMEEAYPSLAKGSHEYEERHKSLKNKLFCAHPWYLLREQLSPAILALVPSGMSSR